LRACGGCGRGLREPASLELYVTQEGLLWCKACRQGGARPLQRGVYELLQGARSRRPVEWASEYSARPSETRDAASELARGLVRRALEAEPRVGRHAKAT
jgi:hypothetical protein